ncbi:hypothetical protein ACHRVW_05695 [Flavobacterium collinsii]|uniref:hypothetical protein n=1 Tax=Flavobacterium collinsii TaxID=1114861 RepID=UPI0037565A79
MKNNFIANEFSPKIVKFQNEKVIQANITSGIWEIDHRDPTVLLWRFNPESASPITIFSGSQNRKTTVQAKQEFSFVESPALLFPEKEAIELSRSIYPFSAVACFTDHCDFDTAENLTIQRTFFKENQIKVTKGFFLNHFSKRGNNASFQNQKEELLEWGKDGHELCYHSLSQSIKSNAESFHDFKYFVPPSSNLKVWIDHGYQPYNLSLFKKNDINEGEFGTILKNKNIDVLWNYIDSGTATNGVINQFNPQHFTLSVFLKGIKDFGLIKKMQLMIKNSIFHYYNDEDNIQKYRNTVTNFKKIVFQRKWESIFLLMKDSLKLSASVFSVFLFWNTNKFRPYRLAKYSPILFKHNFEDKEFYIFQTLEMLDFKKSLSEENIKTLINEKGVFIAHTYFSVPMEYHSGKLFSSPTKIDEKVAERFQFLTEKIKNKEVWNPTLSELIAYWKGFEKIVFDIDIDGNLFEKSATGLEMRKVI